MNEYIHIGVVRRLRPSIVYTILRPSSSSSSVVRRFVVRRPSFAIVRHRPPSYKKVKCSKYIGCETEHMSNLGVELSPNDGKHI